MKKTFLSLLLLALPAWAGSNSPVIYGSSGGVPCAFNLLTNACISGGGGGVSSVGLALPAIFNVSGSPVTTSGTLTGTLATQSANLVWAGPTSGGAATPTFRSLVSADIPSLNYVTSVTGSPPVDSSGGTTPVISMHVADATHDGFLSQGDWSTFNSKQPAGSYALTDLTNLSSPILMKTPDSGGGNSDTIQIHSGIASGTAGTVSIGAGDINNSNMVAILQGDMEFYSSLTQSNDLGGSFGFNGVGIDLFGQGTGTAPTLKFYNGDESKSVAIKALDALATNWTLTLPNNDGSSGQFLQTDGSGVTSWADIPTGYVKYTKTFSDFSDPSNTKTLTLTSLPAGAVIEDLIVHHTAAFTGGTTSDATLNVDVTNGSVASSLPMFPAPSNLAEFMSNSAALAGVVPDFNSSQSFSITLITTGDTIDHLTSGSVDVYLLVKQLP